MTAKDALSLQKYTSAAHPASQKAPLKPLKASTPLSMALAAMGAGAETLTVVDDLTERELGVIDRASMLEAAARFFPQLNESAELTITCPPGHYSASSIAHAVEDVDAHLLNLNVVEGTEPNSLTTVVIRVNHSRGESVARSLARYGYDTIELTGAPGMMNGDLMDRVEALIHYLEV